MERRRRPLLLGQGEGRQASPRETDDTAGAHKAGCDQTGMDDIRYDARRGEPLGEGEGNHHQREF
jgi:hypothetical protein